MRITVGWHVHLLALVPSKLPPPTSPQPAQDVLSVTVSTSPSGYIPDIWTAARSLQIRQRERQRWRVRKVKKSSGKRTATITERGRKENASVEQQKTTAFCWPVVVLSLCFPTLHVSHPSLPDSWQSQSGIGAVQTQASSSEDLSSPLVTWHSEIP